MTFEMLTPREIEVMHFVAVECLTSKQTAKRMGLSYRTIEVHRASILGKTGLHTTCELVREWTLYELVHPAVDAGPKVAADKSEPAKELKHERPPPRALRDPLHCCGRACLDRNVAVVVAMGTAMKLSAKLRQTKFRDALERIELDWPTEARTPAAGVTSMAVSSLAWGVGEYSDRVAAR